MSTLFEGYILDERNLLQLKKGKIIIARKGQGNIAPPFSPLLCPKCYSNRPSLQQTFRSNYQKPQKQTAILSALKPVAMAGFPTRP
jgi:hypothetical protein